MANPNLRIYPKNARLTFDGGLNTKYEQTIIPDKETPDCLNVDFGDQTVATREGRIKFNTGAVGTSTVIDGMFTRIANTGAQTMLVWTGGSLYYASGTTFVTVPSAQSVFTPGAKVCAVQAENYIFFGNGVEIPYKWNGAEFTRHGVYPPTQTAVAATGVGGVPNGTYYYVITNVNSNLVESAIGPVFGPITVTSSAINITNIQTQAASFGVNARRIYRTVASGLVPKRVAEISDNVTTSYVDNIADAALGADYPSDNGVPPKYSVAVQHGASNRIFMNDPANLNQFWYTELDNPYTVNATNFGIAGDNTQDTIHTLWVYQNSLYIGCDRYSYVNYMQDTTPANWVVTKIQVPIGSKSPFSFVNYKDKVVFAAMENGKFTGLAVLEGNSTLPLKTLLTANSAASYLLTDRIEPIMSDVNSTYVSNISAIVFDSRLYFSISKGSGQTTNNRIIFVDYRTDNIDKEQPESFGIYDNMNALYFTVYNNALYYSSSLTDGFVYKMNAGVYNDDGAAINSYFWTKEFSGYEQDINHHKDFRFLNILVDLAGQYYMDVNAKVDSDTGLGNTYQVNLDPGGSLWGSMIWGTDVWGGGQAKSMQRIDLGTLSGKRIQFRFSNQNVADQRFRVAYGNFSYSVKGARI